MDETNTVVPEPEAVTLESATNVIDFWRQRALRAEERLDQASTVLAAEQRDRRAAETEAAALKKLEAAHREEEARQAADLRERLAEAQAAIDERDAELAMLREALDTIPLHEYGDAQREGCDAKGAWDCFKEALEGHISAVRSVSAVYDAKNNITDLRRRLVDAERAAEVRLARIEVLRGALEIVGVEAGVLDLMRERDELRQQLDTVKALVPETDWLEMVAVAQDYFKPGCHKYCPMADGDGNCSLQCDSIVTWATVLAARIRAWRGDGDGEEGEGESDGNA